MVGTLEQALDNMAPKEDLGLLDGDMLPATMRLDIPLDHSRSLRQSAEVLRALAGRLEVLSARTDADERSLLFEALYHGKMARRKLIEKVKDSRTNKVARHKILR